MFISYIILGGQVIDDGYQMIETIAHFAHPVDKDITEFASDLEEVGMRIIPHIDWHIAIYADCKGVLVESNDSDVVIILITAILFKRV